MNNIQTSDLLELARILGSTKTLWILLAFIIVPVSVSIIKVISDWSREKKRNADSDEMISKNNIEKAKYQSLLTEIQNIKI